ncbi:hypothetical protein ACROYT_G022211 [Oculina patagonica]
MSCRSVLYVSFRAFKVVLETRNKIARTRANNFKQASKTPTIIIVMSWFKLFVVCALLFCLMEPCFVEAQRGGGGGLGLTGGIRLKRGVEKEADQRNTRDKRSLFSMLEKRRGPPQGLNAN